MIKLLKNLDKKDYIYAFISIILIVFGVWLDLKMPDYMSNITRLVETNASDIGSILKEGFYMLSCCFGSLVSAAIVGYFVSGIAASFSMKTRKKLFEKVEDLGMEDIKKFEVSSLITRTTNDITQIQMVVAMGLQLLIKAPITAVWAVIKIFGKNTIWSMMTLAAVVILLIIITMIMIIVMPKFKIVQKLID